MSRHIRRENLGRIKAVVLDMDGTVWLGEKHIPGVVEVINSIRAHKLPLAFLTNISARTQLDLVNRLGTHNIQANENEIVTASWLMAREIVKNHGTRHCVIQLGGGPALRETLQEAGITTYDIAEIRNGRTLRSCAIVAIGYTTEFSYEDAKYLVRHSDNIIACYSTDRDRWFADSTGRSPGIGWVVGAVEGALGLGATSIGKPESYGLATIAERFHVPITSILMVGDSIDSDIRAANNSGCLSCLISKDVVTDLPDAHPDYVIEFIAQLIPILESLLEGK